MKLSVMLAPEKARRLREIARRRRISVSVLLAEVAGAALFDFELSTRLEADEGAGETSPAARSG